MQTDKPITLLLRVVCSFVCACVHVPRSVSVCRTRTPRGTTSRQRSRLSGLVISPSYWRFMRHQCTAHLWTSRHMVPEYLLTAVRCTHVTCTSAHGIAGNRVRRYGSPGHIASVCNISCVRVHDMRKHFFRTIINTIRDYKYNDKKIHLRYLSYNIQNLNCKIFQR